MIRPCALLPKLYEKIISLTFSGKKCERLLKYRPISNYSYVMNIQFVYFCHFFKKQKHETNERFFLKYFNPENNSEISKIREKCVNPKRVYFCEIICNMDNRTQSLK